MPRAAECNNLHHVTNSSILNGSGPRSDALEYKYRKQRVRSKNNKPTPHVSSHPELINFLNCGWTHSLDFPQRIELGRILLRDNQISKPKLVFDCPINLLFQPRSYLFDSPTTFFIKESFFPECPHQLIFQITSFAVRLSRPLIFQNN